MSNPQVGIIMGSSSDLKVMKDAADVLKELGIEFEMTVVSAHRTPERMMEYAKEAAGRGLKVIIAGAGGAAAGHPAGGRHLRRAGQSAGSPPDLEARPLPVLR